MSAANRSRFGLGQSQKARISESLQSPDRGFFVSYGMDFSLTPLAQSLASQGFETSADIRSNLGTSALVEASIAAGEGALSKDGALVVQTGAKTGRSAKDKFIVRDATTEETVWWGKVNVPMTPDHFSALKEDFLAALGEKETLYVADLFGGSQSEHRVNVRVINELAWHNLFIRALLVRRVTARIRKR